VVERDPPSRSQRLIGLIRRVGFGTIHGLRVAGGQPVLAPFPRVVQELKFGAEFKHATPRSVEPLRDEDQQFLATLAAIGDGVIETIEVRHGLPFRMSCVLEGPL
jgi:hypothetical protein